MKLIQFWVYNDNMPNYIYHSINSVNHFCRINNWEHILVISKNVNRLPVGEYTFIHEIPYIEKLYHLKKIASKVDYLRYLFVSKLSEEDDCIYLDADIFFFRNPYKWLVPNQNRSNFYLASDIGELCYVNGLFTCVKNCSTIKNLEYLSRQRILSLDKDIYDPFFLGPCPFFTPVVKLDLDKVYIETSFKWLFLYRFTTGSNICNNKYDIDKLWKKAAKLFLSEEAVGYHFYKDHKVRDKHLEDTRLSNWADLLLEMKSLLELE